MRPVKFTLANEKRVHMYEWSNTLMGPDTLLEDESGVNSGRELAREIDQFRRHLLVGIVNQYLDNLPSSLNAAQYSVPRDSSKPAIRSGEPNYDSNEWVERNIWVDFLATLRIFMPKNCNYEFLMTRSSKELNILVNGHNALGYRDNRREHAPITDPDLLDLLADFFGGLDGIFGLILATNSNISLDLRSELLKSDYYLTLPNTSTKKLLENRE
jgi:hypothetical protein